MEISEWFPSYNLTHQFFERRNACKEIQNRIGFLPAQVHSYSPISDQEAELNTSTKNKPHQQKNDGDFPYVAIEMGTHTQGVSGWWDLIEESQDDLIHAKELLEELKAMRQSRTSAHTGYQAVNGSHKNLSSVMLRIRQILTRCGERLVKLEPSTHCSVGEAELRKNLQVWLSLKIEEVSRAAREDYACVISESEEHQELTLNTLGTGNNTTPRIEGANGCNNKTCEGSKSVHQSLLYYNDYVDDLKEVSTIVKTLEDLQSMYSQMGSLVVLQGTVLDRLDYTMELNTEYAEKGASELKKAEKNRLRRRASRVILFLTGFDIFLMFLLGLKVRRRW